MIYAGHQFQGQTKDAVNTSRTKRCFFFHWQHATYTVCSQKRLVEQHPSLILFDIIILFMIYEQASGSQDVLSSCWRPRGGRAAVVAAASVAAGHRRLLYQPAALAR